MKIVITQALRLDEIVYTHYNNLDHLNEVIKVNQHLMTKVILTAGDEVELPEFEAKQNESTTPALWD